MASNVDVGQEFLYVGTEPVVQDDGSVTEVPGPPLGTRVKIRDIVDADEAGAHDNEEDSVVIEWTEAGTVAQDEPVLVPYTDNEGTERQRAVWPTTTGEVTRAISVNLDDFATRYEAVK